MIRRDFHGFKLEEAVAEMHTIIGEVRMQDRVQHAEIITGHGVIQKELLALCEQYGLYARVSMTNSGVIHATIE